jgi:phage/plasmid-associated DNA primase
MTNNIPELNRPDGGAKRRLEVKEFPNKFVSNPTEPFHRPINIDLKEKIIKSEKWRAEMWFLLLDAYNLLQSEGLTPPPDILTSTQSYMDNQNILKVWLEDLYDTDLPLNDRRFQIQSDKLRNHYNQWAIRNKKTEISRQTFSINMEALNRKKKEENKDFVSISYVSEKIGDEWRSEWKEQQNKTGVYYCGLKHKNAPMPPQCLL